MLVLGLLSVIALAVGLVVWPRSTGEVLEHSHEDLSLDHPHLKDHGPGDAAKRHRHAFVIDDEHQIWPTRN